MNDDESFELMEILARIESGQGKPFVACKRLADRIADLMVSRDDRAPESLRIIGNAYDNSSRETLRLSIENGFLFQLGNRIFSHPDRNALLRQLPQNLHDALMHQMLSTGP